MPRGGKREGAGRKATWNAGKTKAVKLPELLLPEIHKLVKAIDDSFADTLAEAENSTFTPLTDKDELIDTIYDSIYDSQAVEAIVEKLLAHYPRLIKSVESEKLTPKQIERVEDTVSPSGSGFSLTPDSRSRPHVRMD